MGGLVVDLPAGMVPVLARLGAADREPAAIPELLALATCQEAEALDGLRRLGAAGFVRAWTG